MTIRIVTDSACDLPDELVEKHRISIVPLTIRFGDEELIDRFELSASEFWARCAATPTLPETAAPAPGQFEEVYRRLAGEDADGIVVVSLSGGVSATVQSAELAARRSPTSCPVRVVDSRSVTLGIGTIALAAARAAEGGADIDASRNSPWTCRDAPGCSAPSTRWRTSRRAVGSAMPGRCSARRLSIKPLIEVRDGVVEQAGKQRTRSKALKHLVEPPGRVRRQDREPRRAPRRLQRCRRVRGDGASLRRRRPVSSARSALSSALTPDGARSASRSTNGSTDGSRSPSAQGVSLDPPADPQLASQRR